MKGPFRLLAALALAGLLASALGGCGQANSTAAKESWAPANPLDTVVNAYEKAAHDYVRAAKKHRAGDVSVTMQVILGSEQTRKLAAQLQQDAAKLTPDQAQRVAEISSTTAPYLLK